MEQQDRAVMANMDRQQSPACKFAHSVLHHSPRAAIEELLRAGLSARFCHHLHQSMGAGPLGVGLGGQEILG